MSLKSFEEEIAGKKFKNPETGNEVVFKSLPLEVQKKLRGKYEKAKAKEEGGNKVKEILKGVDDINFSENGVKNNDAIGEVLMGVASKIEKTYDLKRKDNLDYAELIGVDNLDDTQLDTITQTIETAYKKIKENYLQKVDSISKNCKNELMPQLKKLKDSMSEKEKKEEYLDRKKNQYNKKIIDAEKKNNPFDEDDPIHDELHKVEEEYFKVSGEVSALQRKVFEAESRISEISHMKDKDIFGAVDPGITSLYEQVLKEKTKRDTNKASAARKLRRLQEAEAQEKAQKEKEEKKKQENIKYYKKKFSEIQSKANSAKSTQEVKKLFSELGHIKGELSEFSSFDIDEELKGDLNKTKKSLYQAQDNNTFAGKVKGKIKSFFSKKASLSDDQIFRISCEIAHERAYMESLKKTAREIMKNKSR